MIEIIPVINAKDFEEFKKKARRAEPFFDLVQIDIMDGKFVKTKNFGRAEQAKGLKTTLKWELHLMVVEPTEWVKAWELVSGLQRVIFHVEGITKEEITSLIKRVKGSGRQIGLALNPETPISTILPYLPPHQNFGSGGLNQLDIVLLLTVAPGKSGQKFMPEVIHKIKELRNLWPDGKIEVDGGITPATAKKTVDAGANVLASGSYLFSQSQMAKAVEELRKSIK